MITKHINEYKLFPIRSIPDGAMFIPKTDLGIDENIYLYSKISDYSVEMYMRYADDEDDLEFSPTGSFVKRHSVYALSSDGEIECFKSDTMVYCVGEYDYKLCL
jgi:hypothetical protein